MSEPQTSLITIFCAKEQKQTPHTLEKDGNGEFLFTCADCGLFFKLPAGTTTEGYEAYIQKYEESNKGQVDTSKTDATIADILNKHGNSGEAAGQQPVQSETTPVTPEGITA